MFGLGMGEILVIAVVALLFVGPDKLPQAAKSIGKGIRELRRSTRDLRETIERDADIGDAVREIRSAMADDGRYIPPRPPIVNTQALGDLSVDVPVSEVATADGALEAAPEKDPPRDPDAAA